MDTYHFQYCPKLIILSADRSQVLLCKRKGEADYDGTFSFIGGKMETTDSSIEEGIKREKDEEVGGDFKVLFYPTFSLNILFRKKDGNAMIVPHYLAIYKEGEISLNADEYSEYRWVPIIDLESFEPKIQNIPEMTRRILHLAQVLNQKDLIVI
ncbi:MAG: NUDIX hydrolase [Patescibacteria group bacterium]